MSASKLIPKLLEEYHEPLMAQLLHFFNTHELHHHVDLHEDEWRGAIGEINLLFAHFLNETGEEPMSLHCMNNGAMYARVGTIFDPYTGKIRCYETLLKLLKHYRNSCMDLIRGQATFLNGYLHHASEMTHRFFDSVEVHSFTHWKTNTTHLPVVPMNFEKHYRSLMLGSREGIMVTDANRRIIEVNQAFQAITGYSMKEIVGQTPSILKSGHHDELFYEQMWAALNTEGRWSGEIYNKKKNGEHYLEHLQISVITDERGNVEGYVAHFSNQSDAEASKRKLNYLSHFDSLTGLANQELFKVRMNRAIARSERNNRHFSLLFLDIDNFNVINNTYGHAYGDKVLQVVASRLTPLVRINDTISRYGGDEFMVLLEDYSSWESIEKIGHKLLKAIAEPIVVDGKEFILTASLGVAVYPLDGKRGESLIKHAHVATYQAKQQGKNMLMFYNRSMSEDVKEKLTLTHDLHHALVREEFELHYQPLVNLVNQEVEAVEALIRWNHPERGFISPDDFIPLAEETHQILPIGEWVLHEACRQLKEWEDKGLFHGAMSVNISGIQITKNGFEDQVRHALEASRINPNKLELEITETQVMGHLEQVVKTLENIQQLGVRISIDDFGTGYSSLAHLRALPINKLKIDRQFIKELQLSSDDQAISKAIIAMAKALNLKVLAEGIEEKEQLFYLLSQGCEMGQGYYFSKPLSSDAFLEWLNNR